MLATAAWGCDWLSGSRIACLYARRYRLKGCARVLNRLARWPEPGQGVALRVKVASRAMTLFVDPRDGGDRPSFFEVLWETGRDRLPAKAPDVVVDAGAHVGYFSMLARAAYPGVPIHAFEPLPRNLALLRRHDSANDADLIIHEAALWVREGTLPFQVGKSNAGVLAPVQGAGPGDAGTLPVRCVRLQSAVPSIAAASVLLKLDIEGAELEVLEDVLPVLRGRGSTLLCELHDTRRNVARYSELMAAQGWTSELLKDVGSASYWKHILR